MSNPYAYISNSRFRNHFSIPPLVREFFRWWDYGQSGMADTDFTADTFNKMFGALTEHPTTESVTRETSYGTQMVAPYIYNRPRQQQIGRQ